MSLKITNALKVLAASAMLMTAIASPSLAHSVRYGAQSSDRVYQSYYHHHHVDQAARDISRRDWDR
jgi:hypothetical protein